MKLRIKLVQMSKNKKVEFKDLENKVHQLIQRFKEQQGIIQAYIKKERTWKKTNLKNTNVINKLTKQVKTLKRKANG
tara:strand:- start:14328 stop:14558 length:231 start_codon:yes stop_codon:yes gene_type:complete